VLTSTNANDVKVVLVESHTHRGYLDKPLPISQTTEIALPLSSSQVKISNPKQQIKSFERRKKNKKNIESSTIKFSCV
jgi:hypothetical protein